MTNEEFQKLVIEKLDDMGDQLSKVEGRLSNVEGQLSNVEGRLSNVEGQLSNVEGKLSKVEDRLSNVEGQLTETNDIVKALMHQTEELDAKFDGLLLTTATKEVTERIEETVDRIATIQTTQGESINILALRQLQTESELATLKKVK